MPACVKLKPSKLEPFGACVIYGVKRTKRPDEQRGGVVESSCRYRVPVIKMCRDSSARSRSACLMLFRDVANCHIALVLHASELTTGSQGD
jgi:hypothetical protein